MKAIRGDHSGHGQEGNLDVSPWHGRRSDVEDLFPAPMKLLTRNSTHLTGQVIASAQLRLAASFPSTEPSDDRSEKMSKNKKKPDLPKHCAWAATRHAASQKLQREHGQNKTTCCFYGEQMPVDFTVAALRLFSCKPRRQLCAS